MRSVQPVIEGAPWPPPGAGALPAKAPAGRPALALLKHACAAVWREK